MPNFTPSSVQRWGYTGPQNRNFYWDFIKMWNINAPCTGAYHLRDFHRICRVCSPFQALVVKFLLDFLKGLWSYWGFKLTGSGYPKFSAPGSGETMRQTPKILQVQERARGPLSPCQILWGSDFTRHLGAKNVEFFCLFVCLFVTLLNVKVYPPDFATKAMYSTETMVMPLDRGRFVVVHPVQHNSQITANCRHH